MRDIVNMGMRLLIITVVAALALGFTNMSTEEPIRQQNIKASNEARQAVLSKASTFEELELSPDFQGNDGARIVEVHAGKSGDSIVGYAFKVLSKGFGGDVEVIVGIAVDDRIEAIKVGNHQETPGLGAKAGEEGFIGQYRSKPISNPLAVVKGTASKDNEIQAITGATITSDSVTRGVNAAVDYYKKFLKGGGGSQ